MTVVWLCVSVSISISVLWIRNILTTTTTILRSLVNVLAFNSSSACGEEEDNYGCTYSVARRLLELAPTLCERRLHSYTEGALESLVLVVGRHRHR
jgi:hypothetical protein